jgi:hypothetical protein
VKCTFDERLGIFIRDKPIFSSERCYIRSINAVQLKKKMSGRGSQGA